MVLTGDPAAPDLVAPPGPSIPNRDRVTRRLPSRRLEWCLALLVFLGSFAFRFLSLNFKNDHFQAIAEGRQILLYGELPVRDFVDPGFFLMPIASAAVQLLFGYNLLGEAILTVLLLSLGAMLTFVLASRASRSLVVGSAAAIAVIAMYPRLYHYPKAFLLVLGLFASWRYADRRTPANLVLLALCTALAFLVRHDHGVYVAVAAVVLLIARHWGDRSVLLRRLALYAAVAVAAVLPFFVFLQANGGIFEYFRSGLEYTRSEAKRQQAFVPPSFALEVPPPPPPPRVGVRWQGTVADEVRAQLEARYQLRATGFRGGRSWEYELLDPSPANLEALTKDPRVEDTDGINAPRTFFRSTYEVRDSPPESTFASWLRAAGIGLIQSANAGPWLYYLFVTLPVVAVFVLLVDRARPRPASTGIPFEAAKILSAAALCGVAAGLLLRNPLPVRLPDLAAPTAVIGAWLVGRWLGLGTPAAEVHASSPPLTVRRLPSRDPRFWARASVVLLLAAITWVSILDISGADQRLAETSVLAGPRALLRHGARVVSTLAMAPPSETWAPTSRNVPVARYVRSCTKPTDRLLVTSFEPDLYFFAGRAFAGDQIFFYPEYRTSPEDQQRTLARLEGQSVPIVLVDVGRHEGDIRAQFGLLHDYLTRRYAVAGEARFDQSDPVVFRVLVDRQLIPTGSYEPLGLPCFR